jgi:Fe-S-cluster-containing dehydrogenase component
MRAVAVPPSFVFDPNTCVGCHACAIACINENRLAPGRFWRQIVTFNPARRPGLRTWHLSIACNHCLDAPCLRGCPARAIARDGRTGAVLIHDERCVGCRYCSWVCPYDAPRFDAGRGVMGKCTFCSHRLLEGLAPACASLCPTGALRIGPLDASARPAVRGVTDIGIRPALQVLALRPRTLETQEGDILADMPTERPADAPPAKLSFGSEWSLAVFTFAAILLVAWVAAALLGGPPIRVWPLLAVGAVATAVSTLHLGRSERAWRAVVHWRESWLSREVLTWSAFLAVTSAALVGVPPSATIGWAAVGVGFACLACVDQVYVSMARPSRSRLDDVAAVTSAGFLAGVLAQWPVAAVPLGAWRLVAFAARARGSVGSAPGAAPRAIVRVGLGALATALGGVGGSPTTAAVAAVCALAGEAIDRADFYDRLDVVTPAREMARAESDPAGVE